ncbi:MAG: helix-turn-helix domain-containing protein [Clostridia bacterium]|nr:helix-turn-helix domain-containing protein [Clostridia bacterium]
MFRADILAQNIKKCRIKMGLTQNELAEKLFLSGQAISKWESAHSIPDIGNLCAMAEVFSTSVDKLIGNTSSLAEKILIGIDGGASKTEFVLFTDKGNILHHLSLDGSNPNVSGFEKAFTVLKTGIDALTSIHSDIHGIFAGISGYLSGNNYELFNARFKKNYPLLNITLDSDIRNVISSATNLNKCIAVICGTGLAIFANENGNLKRLGAWGYLLDDIGGGYGIGREALRASLAERDGFGKKTIITAMVEEKLGGEVWNNLNKIYSSGDSFIASFAPLVFNAYKEQDAVAIEIFNNFAKKTAERLKFALDTYDCGKNIVISGGLVSENDILINLISDNIDENVNFIKPDLPQIYGACCRCCELYGNPDKNFYNNFRKNYMETVL